MDGEQEAQQPVNISIDAQREAGVYANFASVSHSPYEFTLDFVRLNFGSQPPTGILVARVSLSPLLVSQLIEALQKNWQMFAEKALPKEVYDGPDDRDSRSSE